MHEATRLIHLGRSAGARLQAVNPPLVRASTTLFADVDAYRMSYAGRVFEAPRYGRSGTVTSFELQEAVARIAGAQTCIATGSGLNALAAVLGAHAGKGRHIVVHEGVYGPTRTLCESELTAWGTRVDFFETCEDLERLVDDGTSLVFIEVPTSLTMRMVDVRAVCAIARRRGIPVACDASWGTPLFFDAHGLGIDIAVHAGTKFINGHSDVMLGLVTGSFAALEGTRRWCDHFGSHASPDVCWLTLRGLRTLDVRMRRHAENTLQVAQWLQDHPAVERVMFPALPSDPGHALWREQFSGAGGPFTIELKPCSQAAFDAFVNGLRLFGVGTSWGGFESLVMPAVPYHLRALPVLPDEGRLVRLHIGLEDWRDLRDDLASALAVLGVAQSPGN